jgi:hypothetical protein
MARFFLLLLALLTALLVDAAAPVMTIESNNMTYSYYDGRLSQGRPIYDEAKVISKSKCVL